jgi:hypothetical protein
MAIYTLNGSVLLVDGGIRNCCCDQPTDCNYNTVDVPANRGFRTGTGVFITNALPYLSVSSWGEITLIPEKPPDPAVIFNAPAQLQIYVGATMVAYGETFSDRLMTERGQVFFRIQDTGRFDNSGSYSCFASACPFAY